MDRVPYEFVDSVLAGLSRDTINNIKVQSRDWSHAARIYKNKLREVVCNILSADNGFKFRIECTGPNYPETITINRLDPRFHRVIGLNVQLEGIAECDSLDMMNLSQMIAYVSLFPLEFINIDCSKELLDESDVSDSDVSESDSNESWTDFLKKLMEELVKCEPTTKSLDLGFAPESVGFLRKMLQNPDVTTVNLTGEWDLRDDDFKEIFACWASQLERECTTINMETDENLEVEFETWMVPTERLSWMNCFTLQYEDSVVYVECDSDSCTVTFIRT